LRQDNADLRLTEISYRLGLASEERMQRVIKKRREVDEIKKILKTDSADASEINEFLETIESSPISERQKLEKILLRPGVGMNKLAHHLPAFQESLADFDKESIEQTEIQIKYQVYIDKERELVQRMSLMEDLPIPSQFDYDKIGALGVEAREKLIKIRPQTLGQASRISGINPSDVQILMVFMGR
jgi:tRNA uridine 5-carboxymethylaminomethyl modification enzyme